MTTAAHPASSPAGAGRAGTVAWIAAGALMALSIGLPPTAAGVPLPQVILAAAFIAVGAFGAGDLTLRRVSSVGILTALGWIALIGTVHRPEVAGAAGPGFWLQALALLTASGLVLAALAARRLPTALAQRAADLAVPVAFGVVALCLWEIVVVGFGVPGVLMPSPSAIFRRMAAAPDILLADFRQTFLKGALVGWTIGSAAGLAVALLADRVPYLRRGLLPLGNFVAALPVIGTAPIMVMWFGFDWPSKAAVVVLMTFFPMLVNASTGLAAAGASERDLMRSYGAGYLPTLLKLRLPAALPFIMTALKLNATLALIGAIVAEFFGTPTVGMGFRISTEVGRMRLDMVWAEIVVAAVAGSLFYGLLSLVERAGTFWHPSYRTRPVP